MNCEQASTNVFTDNQGRAWEQFNLNNQGVFLNQIPDVQSFTRTNPGWVLADNGYCTWVGQPPARIRTEMPVLAPATVAPSTVPTAEADPGVAMGFMVLIALAGSAGFAYWKRQREDKEIEKYNPHAHIPTDLPFSLSGGVKPQQTQPEELWINEDDPIPEGYTLVDDVDDTPAPSAVAPALPAAPSPPHLSTPATLAETGGDRSGDRSGDSLQRQLGDRSGDRRQWDTSSADVTEEFRNRVLDSLEENYQTKPLYNVTGLTLTEFKQGHCPDGGKFDINKLDDDDELMDFAKAHAFKFLEEYKPHRIKFMVWWVFGMTQKGGESPSATKYRQCELFCKECIAEWEETPF